MKERVTESAHSGNQDKAFCKMSYSEMKTAKCASLSNIDCSCRGGGMQKRKHSCIVKNAEFTSKISTGFFAYSNIYVHIDIVPVYFLIF